MLVITIPVLIIIQPCLYVEKEISRHTDMAKFSEVELGKLVCYVSVRS